MGKSLLFVLVSLFVQFMRINDGGWKVQKEVLAILSIRDFVSSTRKSATLGYVVPRERNDEGKISVVSNFLREALAGCHP